MIVQLGVRPVAAKIARHSLPTVVGIIAALFLVTAFPAMRRAESGISASNLAIVSAAPEIRPIADGRRWQHGGMQIVPRAAISVRAQLVKKTPRMPTQSEKVETLAIYDFVLAWREWVPQPHSSGDYQTRTLEIRAIPGSGHIRPLLDQFLVGDTIALKGYLLATGESNDSGLLGVESPQRELERSGAEIMWVDEAERGG